MASFKVIGITGHPAAGKDLASEYFAGKGFKHISMGDFLRTLMREENIPTDRSSIRTFVKEMRTIHGNQFPAEEIMKSIDGNTVITGFRNIAEVETFRKQFNKDFIMIAVDASLEVRYARIHSRGRDGDDISFEKFKEEEDKERREESGSHEMDKVIETADFLVQNNGTRDQLFEELREIQAHTP